MDLSELLTLPSEEVPEDTPLPEGYYVFRTGRGKLTEPATDKNGREYVRAVFPLFPQEAVTESIKAEFEEWVDANDRPVMHSEFVAATSDVRKLFRIFSAAGVPTSGRSLPEVLEELKDGYQLYGQVKHREYDGRIMEDVSDLAAVKS